MERYEADEGRAFVAAAAEASRLDEAVLRDTFKGALYLPVSLRREAAAAASLEGFLVRPEALARTIADREASADRGSRLAADLFAVLSMSSEWPDSGPGHEQTAAAFMTGDASSGRLMRPDVQWTVEEDAAWLSRLLEGFAESADPWTAAETIREIWTSGRFFGNARRMAMACAPWVFMRGLGCSRPLPGFAGEVSRDPDGFREASRSQHAWAARAASAAAAAFARERALFEECAAARVSMIALCPPGRSSSSIEAVVGFCFASPVFTAKDLCTRLGLTPTGAKHVLDRMVSAGVLSVDSVSRNRKYTCRRIP